LHPCLSCVIETAVKLARITPPVGTARAVTASAALVENFRRRAVIVLSPHFDDACFSLGGFLSARGGQGLLVNIFTKGTYLVRPDLVEASPPGDEVHFIRDGEDREFAWRCGLQRHDLECEEPSLRGRRPSQMGGLGDDIAQAEEKLLTFVMALAAGRQAAPALFVPLGIGRHVNHRATAEIVMRNLRRVRAAFDVHFYEELPYASHPFHRLAALKRLRLRAGPAQRQVFAAPWREKRELIGIYQSQLRAPPSALSFRPAALPLAAHEAFWSLTKDS
jgi:LmbE family N-acetylglucosaminyl deacetylase